MNFKTQGRFNQITPKENIKTIQSTPKFVRSNRNKNTKSEDLRTPNGYKGRKGLTQI